MYSYSIRPYYLLDTNIVSEPTKPKTNKNVLDKLTKYSSVSAVSSITLAELWQGIQHLPDGCSKQRDLIDYFNEEVSVFYQEIPFDRSAAIIYGDIYEILQSNGKTKPKLDMMIAATAIANGMTLVTHNTKDFEDIPNLMVEDWFEPETE